MGYLTAGQGLDHPISFQNLNQIHHIVKFCPKGRLEIRIVAFVLGLWHHRPVRAGMGEVPIPVGLVTMKREPVVWITS